MAEEHRYGETFEEAYSWGGAISGLAAAVAIVILATAAGTLGAMGFDQWTGLDTARPFGPGEMASLTAARLAVFLMVFQVAAVLLTLLAARFFRRARGLPLALGPLDGGVGRALGYGGLLIVLASVFTAAVYAIDRNALFNDLLLFRDVLATDVWWSVALAAVIGAPIAEELVFRGLLYGVFRSSPVGPVVGGVVTALVWASIHAQYTVYGVVAIFLIGLYLAWVREKTGGVIGPIVCHAVYNAAVLSVILLAPARFLEPG